MATRKINNNQNNQDNNDNELKVSEDATAGDILEQLKADSASTANLYKLELKLFKTVTNMDKTMTKEHKVIIQAKRNLDSMHAALSSISKDTGNIRTTVSSVDTTLKQVLAVLTAMQGNSFSSNSNSNSNSNSGSTSHSSSSTLSFSEIESKINHERQLRNQAQRDYDAGTITEQEYVDALDDTSVNIGKLTKQMADANQSLANILQKYDNYKTFDERIQNSIQSVLNRYNSGEIDSDTYEARLGDLRKVLEEHTQALHQAERDWDDDGQFRFAKKGINAKQDAEEDFKKQKEDLIARFQHMVPDENGHVMDNDEFSQAMLNLTGEKNEVLSGLDSQIKIQKSVDDLITKFREGKTYDPKTGTNTTASATVDTLGKIGGELVGSEVGAAIGTAIGGPVGTVVGGILGDLIGSKIEALTSIIGDRLDYLANHSKKTRDEILQAGLDKIKNDVKDMATYSIEIYETASKNIYAAWDKNLGQLTAVQGYTKEALNSLQDSVAQRLQEEGYGNTIDASQFLDQLSNTLNANLGGTLAEAFATQNLILQKAVPEVDLSTSAAQFAAIYTNANRQNGNGEETMIAAMNEIAGAAKALETVTDGNNQFLKETGALLSKATEVVNIAGGNADQIAGLTTQMMASEAAITSLSPQLSGFTSELVGILMNNNDATAVSLRAIMNDIDSNIGVSATSFMKSFMDDTQGTLSTAFAAIQKFIDQNENEASKQEFLNALESVFGVSGSKLAQIDFGSVSELIAQVNTSTNMAALTDAENLVRSGETTTMEEQLLANSTNQLLATNAISATIDNKLMRKLESNELAMERLVYSAQATQSVDLAENTLSFFTKITDLIMSIIDPFGLFDMLTTSINASTSAAIDAERYLVTSTMATVGSTVADSSAGLAATFANTTGGAAAVIAASQTKSTDAMVAAVEMNGVSPTFETMMLDYSAAQKDAQAAIAKNSAESNVVSYAAMEQQAKQSSEYQQKQDAAKAQDARYEEDKAAAREQQKIAQEAEDLRNIENHDNIVIIKDALDSLDMSEYLTPILEEHRTHTEQIKDLQQQTAEIVRLFSTIIEYSMATSPEFASTISFDERARIMDNGYVMNSRTPFF